MLHRNCLLKQVTEGKIEGRSEGKTRKNTYAASASPQGNYRILEIERGNIR